MISKSEEGPWNGFPVHIGHTCTCFINLTRYELQLRIMNPEYFRDKPFDSQGASSSQFLTAVDTVILCLATLAKMRSIRSTSKAFSGVVTSRLNALPREA